MTVIGSAFARLATVTASTKRMSTVDGTTGLAGTSPTFIAEVKITPPVPISTAMSARLDVTLVEPILESPYELLQAFCEGNPDIQKGDIVVIAGKEYPVSFAEDWSFRNDHRLRLILANPDER